MIDSKYLILNTEFFNIECEIKDYHYNKLYKLWTFVFFNSDILFVYADGSGSMTVSVGGGRTTVLDVANALAIYTSEHNTGVYRNKYITFSNNPQFVEFDEENTLQEKLKIASEHCEIENTNIEKVFDLILYVAIKNDIPKEIDKALEEADKVIEDDNADI